MGDDDPGAAFEETTEGDVDQALSGGIEEEDAGEGEDLGLTGGETADARSEDRVQTVGQLLEPGGETEGFEDAGDPRIGDVRVEERQIVADSGAEQMDLLRDQTDAGT